MALQRSEFGQVSFGRAGSVTAVLEYDDVDPFPVTAIEVTGNLDGRAMAVVVVRNIDLTPERGNEIRFETRTNGTFRRVLTRTEREFWRFDNVPEVGNPNRVKTGRGIEGRFEVRR